MPQRATYGVAARTPGLGVQRHATQLQGDDDFPPGFDPLTDYWWDGSDPSTMWQNTAKTTPVIAGSPVRVWASKGVAVDAVAPSDPARATWDGTNKLTFSGAQQYTATFTSPVGPQQTQVVVIEKTSVPLSFQAILGQDGNQRLRSFFQNTSSGILYQPGDSGVTTTTVNVSPTTAVPAVLILVFVNNAHVLRWNTVENSANQPIATNPQPDLVIGNKGSYTSSVGFLHATISSVYIKPNYAADITERAALETWFAAKYGVVLPE